MILVDTSVWIDHLREQDPRLNTLLEGKLVVCHPFVIGEIAVASIKDREEIVESLHLLTRVAMAQDAEVLHLISHHRLFGQGIGYVDAHLLTAARISPGTSLWTKDKRLLEAARRLGLAFESHVQ